MEVYLSFLDKANIEKDKNNIISFIKTVVSIPPKKKDNIQEIIKNRKNENKNEKKLEKKRNKSNKTIIYQNNSSIIKLNIKRLEIKGKTQKQKAINNKNFPIKLNNSRLKKFKTSKKINKYISNVNLEIPDNILIKKEKKNVKFKLNNKRNEMNNKLNKFVEDYLSKDIDDKDFYEVIKLDKRTFCQYFWEKIKTTLIFLDIILINEPLKPKPIKIVLFLIKIDLYFLINGLFMNEDYISEIYHSNDDESIFSFVKRTNYNLFYISTIGVFSGYLFGCFFYEENKIKRIFIREKMNQFNIKKDIFLLIKKLKSQHEKQTKLLHPASCRKV